MTPRSYLFVPADRPERFSKALEAGADAVIIDLEDAVAPEAKVSARSALTNWLEYSNAEVIVRINSAETPWFEDDLLMCQSSKVVQIMVPKSECPDVLARVTQKPLLPLIESAAGIESLRDLAVVPNVERFVFGSIDFQLDVGIDGDGDELLMFRSEIVLVSRLAQLASPVDGVSTKIGDSARLIADVKRAKRLGFGAKLCIHPKQVSEVNRGFNPSQAEIDWAQRVVAASAAAGGGAIAVDGTMIDKPVLQRAQRIADQAIG